MTGFLVFGLVVVLFCGGKICKNHGPFESGFRTNEVGKSELSRGN